MQIIYRIIRIAVFRFLKDALFFPILAEALDGSSGGRGGREVNTMRRIVEEAEHALVKELVAA